MFNLVQHSSTTSSKRNSILKRHTFVDNRWYVEVQLLISLITIKNVVIKMSGIHFRWQWFIFIYRRYLQLRNMFYTTYRIIFYVIMTLFQNINVMSKVHFGHLYTFIKFYKVALIVTTAQATLLFDKLTSENENLFEDVNNGLSKSRLIMCVCLFVAVEGKRGGERLFLLFTTTSRRRSLNLWEILFGWDYEFLRFCAWYSLSKPGTKLFW